MISRWFSMPVLLFAAGCVGEPSPPSPEAGAAPQSALEIIEFDRQVLAFEPTRDDLSVAKAVFTVHCSKPEEVRLNGAQPASQWIYLDLAQVSKNRFELAPLRIEVLPERVGLLCLSVKVWFNEVPNEYDSLYYQKTDDRYALVSYCDRAEGPDWKEARPRYRQNRVAELKQFREALSKPFPIRLNQRPLSDLERLKAPRQGR